jgi:hypothetical protein
LSSESGIQLFDKCTQYISSSFHNIYTFISMQTILWHTLVFQCCIFCGAHLYFNAAYFVAHTCISMLLILWCTLVFQCCLFCGALVFQCCLFFILFMTFNLLFISFKLSSLVSDISVLCFSFLPVLLVQWIFAF